MKILGEEYTWSEVGLAALAIVAWVFMLCAFIGGLHHFLMMMGVVR